MDDPTNGLAVDDLVKVVNSTMRGTIVESRCAHLVKMDRTGREYWYLATDLEATQ